MKLYRSKVSVIAKEAIELLCRDQDIEVVPEHQIAAEEDLGAIMDDYLRRDSSLRERVRDQMAAEGRPYHEYGRTRARVAEEQQHPIGDDVERFLARQFVESLMISPAIDEIYADDATLYRKLLEVLVKHHVDEGEIREAAQARVKNLEEGTEAYNIALQKAITDIKVSRGLLDPHHRHGTR